MTDQTQTAAAAERPENWLPDRLMTRQEASTFARALGVPVAVATLAKLAVRGGADAPVITYFARRPLYRVAEFRSWVEGRFVRARSTAEADRRRTSRGAAASAQGAAK